MKRRVLLAATGAACLLAACGKEGSADKAAAPATAVSVERIAAEAKGFNVGPAMSAHVVYVFFDAQCPHCAALWEAAKPLKAQARFVWIPVGLLGDKSVAQGAAILAAADPVASMEQNEASVSKQQGGIGAIGVAEAQKDAVRQNTKLLTAFGFGGVPTVIGKNAQSGQLVTIDGAVPTVTLAQKLGLTLPGG